MSAKTSISLVSPASKTIKKPPKAKSPDKEKKTPKKAEKKGDKTSETKPEKEVDKKITAKKRKPKVNQ